MAVAYLDTSALARRYFPSEPGAGRVRAFCAAASDHLISTARVTRVEFAAAITRRVREGTLPLHEQARHWRAFALHWETQYRLINATEQVYAEAERLIFRYPLRGFDALHLASALALTTRVSRASLTFWTADRQQADAAQREGLVVELLP